MLTDTQRRTKLILQGRLNNTDIAKLTKCSRNTVANWRKRLTDIKISWEEVEGLSDTELRKIVTPKAFAREHSFERPDMDQVLFELSERGIAAKTLYREYLESAPENARTISLTTFYRAIESHADSKNVTASFEYEAGEMVQADFVGRKTAKHPVLLDDQSQERNYEVFCAASAKGRKIYAIAIESQAKLPVLDAFVSMLEFFGGVPVLVTIDNFKAAVSKPRRGSRDAELTPEFQELADHYQFGLMTARIRKPKDKSIAENSVGILQNDVMAPLRNRRLFSLYELNLAIMERLQKLNDRPFSNLTGESRNQLFARLDAPGYRPLPDTPYEPGRWVLKLRVGRDYHVHVNDSRYSVPFRLANEVVNAKITSNCLHLFYQGKIVATHLRSIEAGKLVTNPDHMPPAHRQASMLRLSGMKSYVREIGPNAERFVDAHFRANKNPRNTAKVAIRLRALTAQYTAKRIETACARSLIVGKCTIAKVENILASGVDQLKHDLAEQMEPPEPKSNVRGASYFEGLFTRRGEIPDV